MIPTGMADIRRGIRICPRKHFIFPTCGAHLRTHKNLCLCWYFGTTIADLAIMGGFAKSRGLRSKFSLPCHFCHQRPTVGRPCPLASPRRLAPAAPHFQYPPVPSEHKSTKINTARTPSVCWARLFAACGWGPEFTLRFPFGVVFGFF